MFRVSVKGTGYPLHSPVSPVLPLPFVTVCHHISTGLHEHYSVYQLHCPGKLPCNTGLHQECRASFRYQSVLFSISKFSFFDIKVFFFRYQSVHFSIQKVFIFQYRSVFFSISKVFIFQYQSVLFSVSKFSFFNIKVFIFNINVFFFRYQNAPF